MLHQSADTKGDDVKLLYVALTVTSALDIWFS